MTLYDKFVELLNATPPDIDEVRIECGDCMDSVTFVLPKPLPFGWMLDELRPTLLDAFMRKHKCGTPRRPQS